MALDDSFAGFSPDGVPDADLDFSVKEEPCPTNPDVIVDIKQSVENIGGRQTLEEFQSGETPTDEIWIRMPVTLVELFINKDGPADITRTAKVEFPAEWGGHSINQYVNGFQAQDRPEIGDPYDECRIFFRDQRTDGWQISHYGYVGGVGPAADNGVFKFWCYDPADLMKGIQVSASFGRPTIHQILNFVLNGTDNNGREIGVNRRSVFENVRPYIAGTQEVAIQKADIYDRDTPDGISVPDNVQVKPNKAGPLGIDLNDVFDDAFDWFFGTEEVTGELDILLDGQKRFQVNRHNLVDVMEWFSAEVGGKWHFEPTPEGPILFYDNTGANVDKPDATIRRRVFVEDAILDEDLAVDVDTDGPVSGFGDKEAFAPVDTLDNDALVDIKPFNTLVLYGESTTFREKYSVTGGSGGTEAPKSANYDAAAAPGSYTEAYPYVKVTYEPLLERAGGYPYSAPPIESDKVYLDQAKKHAVREFRKHLSEETEGELSLKGEPHVIPFDYLRTIPTCNDIFPNADASPITYEVNGVKHRRAAGERYTTELGVSLTLNENKLNVEAEYREA